MMKRKIKEQTPFRARNAWIELSVSDFENDRDRIVTLANRFEGVAVDSIVEPNNEVAPALKIIVAEDQAEEFFSELNKLEFNTNT